MDSKDSFLISYFTDTQAEMRWRREVEYKLLAVLLPLAPLLVAGLYALAALGDKNLTVVAAITFTVFVWMLYFYVRKKVKAEHSTYEELGQITVKLWERYGLFNCDSQQSALLPETSRGYGKGSGYELTLNVYLIISIAATIMLLGIGYGAHSSLIPSSTRETYPEPALRVAASAAQAADTASKDWRLHALSSSDDGATLTATFLRRDQDSGYKVTISRASLAVLSVEATNVRTHQAISNPLSMLEIQARLAKAGLYKGQLDGLVGRQTERAIRAFQRSLGLSDTGQTDTRTLQELAKLPPPQ